MFGNQLEHVMASRFPPCSTTRSPVNIEHAFLTQRFKCMHAVTKTTLGIFNFFNRYHAWIPGSQQSEIIIELGSTKKQLQLSGQSGT